MDAFEASDTDEFSERWAPYAIAALRIVTALLFLQHGTSKILDWPHTSMSGPPMWTMFWVAGMIELVGGLLLLVGLFTRWTSFILAGEMAIAYFMIHASQSFFPVINRGEAAVLFCFIFLLFVATGAGKWSIDAITARNRTGVEGYAGPGGERQYNPEDFGDKAN